MSNATSWNPETYAQNARFVSDLGEPLLNLLAAKPEETILDLGCGDGALTEKVAALGANVFAIDSSLPQVAAARRRGLNAIVMDAQALSFKRSFDAVLTNAVLHWLKRPENALHGVASCLRAGGRFIGEFGGKGNVETIRSALHAGLAKRGIDPWSVDPWYYPGPEQFADLLENLGFAAEYIELIPRPTRLPGDILGWLEIFAQPFVKALPDSAREKYLEEIRNKLRPKLAGADGIWRADYVRLRFKALRR